MSFFDAILDSLGRWLARRVTRETYAYEPYAASRPDFVREIIRPGDVLLIEGGRSKIASAIKFLTQSTWSHAALYVGDIAGAGDVPARIAQLIEAEPAEGVIASPLEKYARFNTRICRPVGLSGEDRAALIAFAVARIGNQYDLRNVFDLLRFFLPNPPVPMRYRRRMIALGSGAPTRAICSTLIARAFESVRYPILPDIEQRFEHDAKGMRQAREILHIQDTSLFTPRDFDVSPYFEIVKPTLMKGFDYHALIWADQDKGAAPAPPAPV